MRTKSFHAAVTAYLAVIQSLTLASNRIANRIVSVFVTRVIPMSASKESCQQQHGRSSRTAGPQAGLVLRDEHAHATARSQCSTP